MVVFKTVLIAYYLMVITYAYSKLENEEAKAVSYMEQLNQRESVRYKRSTEADWTYQSNITEHNLQMKVAIGVEIATERKRDLLKTTQFNWKSFRDPDLRRQFKKFTIIHDSALPSKALTKFSNIIGDMEKIYSTSKICDFHNKSKCNLHLEPELTHILSTSRNPHELKHIWVEWRKATGPKVRKMFPGYVSLSNEAARANGFTNQAEAWLDDFESHNIREQFHKIWQQIKPLYLQIHAYVRHKLRKKYGDIVSKKGPIPAHLLGNMWAQAWSNIADFTLPYPDIASATVTDEMIKQGYTPLKMFHLADNFFTSLNLTEVPESFWNESVLEKPEDGRELVCHASAWDLYDMDVRIKQCTSVTEEELYVVHHEMGHVQYYLQYADQPVAYREGANSGFHEAVGDVIALSVSSPKHLHKIGLLKEPKITSEELLNNLYKIGLHKIAFLPFGYLIDLWRWDVFTGKTPQANWNCEWWRLRHEYQGIEPPVDRSEDDFDPAAKYHIIADVPYIRYFVSFIAQFQFHRALCEIAGEYVPGDPTKRLNNCDIYRSPVAGEALSNMLRMGSSKPWPDAMEVLTGQRNMDASALLEYFKPLHNWLKEHNKKNGLHIGWLPSTKVCHGSRKKKSQ